jgi:hypothetical protein
MSHSVTRGRRFPGLFASGAALLLAVAPASGQEATRILSSEISVSREAAAIKLELENGRVLDLAVREGRAYVDGSDAGAAARSGELDRAWRDLLERAIDAPTGELPALLSGWSPPPGEGPGRNLDRALEEALAGVPVTLQTPSPDAVPMSDSVERLVERISELEQELEGIHEEAISEAMQDMEGADAVGDRRGGRGPFFRLWRGIQGIISALLLGAILFGVGFAAIFFGGRQYIEGVADTARASTTRSLLVGLAAMFLIVPAYVLGMIALAISIVGIPALLLWIPLFPIAVGLAGVLGYLGVAHAAGEALAERRFSGTDWFRRGNSYYFLMSGLGLLFSLFIASRIVSITGIDFFAATLFGIGMVVTWAAVSIGLGAVLLSRGGRRAPGRSSASGEPEIYAEESHA